MCSLRNFAKALEDNDNISVPLITNDDGLLASGLSKVPKMCNKVVFPAPEAPTIDTISPLATFTDTPLSTSKSL